MIPLKPKDVLFMPERSSGGLASAVARALRSAKEPMENEKKRLEAVNGHDEVDEEELFLEEDSLLEDDEDYEESLDADDEDSLEDFEEDNSSELREVALELIEDNPFQTRDIESEEELESLAASITRQGLIQPVILRELEEGYQLVAGERRLRAARLAGLDTIPALVKVLSDQEACEFSFIENSERENLNPIEEALALRQFADTFGLKHGEIGKLVGKNRTTVSNSLRLLNLEEEVMEMLRGGELSAGHGRALLAVDDPKLQKKLARKTVATELSVRALEALVAQLNEPPEEEFEEDEELEKQRASLKRLETRVRSYLDLEEVKVSLDAHGRKRLNVVFDTEASWKRFVSKIKE